MTPAQEEPHLRDPLHTWRRSSFCESAGCVHFIHYTDRVALADEAGNTVSYTDEEWDAFIRGAKAGEFDRPRIPMILR